MIIGSELCRHNRLCRVIDQGILAVIFDWVTNLETLDNLHALAVDNSIVTPYSSMIVLVNQQQRTLLKQLENGQGRFDREFEDVGETEELSPFAVTGVPEPEEWLLIILAVAMLAWYWSNKRREGHGARPSASP